MQINLAIIAAVAGYLIGSISFARLVGRIVAPGVDFTEDTQFVSKENQDVQVNLHAVSATTIGNRVGPAAGMTAGMLDVLKVLIPAVVLRFVYPGELYYLVFALAGMIGHVWPLYYRFHGGRGLSVAFASFLVVDPIGTFVTWIVGTSIGMFVLHDPLTSFLGWMWLMIPWLWIRTHDWRYVAFAAAINLIMLLALIPQIKVYVRYYREGKAPSFEDAMRTTHMGRMLHKMGIRMHLLKPAPSQEQQGAGGSPPPNDL